LQMVEPKIDLIWDAKNELGEGPLWDVHEQLLYWIDSKGPTINRYNPRNDSVQTWKVQSDIGSMALREKGGAIVALRDGIYAFDFETGKSELMVAIDEKNPRTRLNDGKVDRRGRFFVGGMDEEETGRMAGLYRFDTDHTLVKLEDGIVCFNMPCWSPDDKVFYAAETWEHVFAYDYDIETGSISNKRAIVDMRNNPGGSDGSTVDEDGFIWNAQVITGKLIRYAPDGRIDRSIDFPVKNLTSVSFGGPDLDVLYVTSMRRIAHPANGKFSRPSAPEPLAGGLWRVTGLGVRGLPEPRYAG
jgi:L-arabinonolactonase